MNTVTPEELLSLRMLLIGAPASDRALWEQGASRASVPIEFFSHDSGRTDMPQGGMDIIVLDADLPALFAGEIVRRARGEQSSPLIVVCGALGHERRPRADGVLPRPAAPADARRLADLCIRARLPNRTLIVDDSATMRSIVRKILSACHFRLDIVETADGESALESIRSSRFGLAFVDYNMPGCNGIDILKEMRRERESPTVILMTSSLETGLADHATAAGAFAFLKKPFYPADVDVVLGRYYGLAGTTAGPAPG